MRPPGCAASHRIAQEIEERGRILSHQLRDIGAGERQQIASGGDRRRHVRRRSAGAAPRRGSDREESAAADRRASSKLARAIDGTRHPRGRSPARREDPSTHASMSSRVFGDGMSFRRRADDVQLIEAAEAREETAERLNHAAVARQQRQHVGVERQAPCAFDRDDQPERHDRDDDRAAGDAPTRRWQQPGIPRIEDGMLDSASLA